MPEPVHITFLGTGSGIPSLKRSHPAILFRRAGDYWLFDCGEGAQLGLERAGVSPVRIGRIFISHWHADHFAGLLPMLETMHLMGRTAPLEIYGPEAGRFVDDIMDLSYWGVGFKIRAVGSEEGGKLLETSDYIISSVKVDHGIPAVGYVYEGKPHWSVDIRKARSLGIGPGPILAVLREKGRMTVGGKVVRFADIAKAAPGRKVAYSGDTKVCRRLFEAARGADVLIHDSTFVEPVPTKFHSDIKAVAKMSKRYGIRKLVLTHFSRRYQDPKEILSVAKPAFKNVVIARDGLEMTV